MSSTEIDSRFRMFDSDCFLTLELGYRRQIVREIRKSSLEHSREHVAESTRCAAFYDIFRPSRDLFRSSNSRSVRAIDERCSRLVVIVESSFFSSTRARSRRRRDGAHVDQKGQTIRAVVRSEQLLGSALRRSSPYYCSAVTFLVSLLLCGNFS
jgi:hypothetical protein